MIVIMGLWIESQKESLQIDTSKIVLYGQSAGGGLVIATAMMVRDKGSGDKISNAYLPDAR